MSYYFDHEKLEVYRFAIRFVVLADEIAENLPRGLAYLVDQLLREITQSIATLLASLPKQTNQELFAFFESFQNHLIHSK